MLSKASQQLPIHGLLQRQGSHNFLPLSQLNTLIQVSGGHDALQLGLSDGELIRSRHGWFRAKDKRLVARPVIASRSLSMEGKFSTELRQLSINRGTIPLLLASAYSSALDLPGVAWSLSQTTGPGRGGRNDGEVAGENQSAPLLFIHCQSTL
jgi:hypothetical protein